MKIEGAFALGRNLAANDVAGVFVGDIASIVVGRGIVPSVARKTDVPIIEMRVEAGLERNFFCLAILGRFEGIDAQDGGMITTGMGKYDLGDRKSRMIRDHHIAGTSRRSIGAIDVGIILLGVGAIVPL
ncbi:hypothetical protein [Sphingomonas sp. PAMC 26605]|uniref:hypothetical protein n=1 Tax=Sphingomonas sp. PAMC 26605 TaxID=1112214 RepID=UPI0012F49B74|nr:hypothetical protein [Sphingomonas sp. PAMC 26605]